MNLLKTIAFPPFFALLTLLLMVAAHLVLPLRVLYEFPISLVGLVPIAFGGAVMVLAVRCFSRAETTIIPFRESSSLIIKGPYKFTRNPIYVADTLILIGASMLFGTLSPLLCWPLFVLIVDLGFIRVEERMLTEKFGDDYAAYKRQVRRWL